ncbi:uncharacterized protein LOC135954418 [Calliphora vicina]|uniref:uncharacterized protein LOC135954418 n=1 Tax=Calliphora vicina TaxID=7373 RepID=UPI00325B06B7
MTQNFLFMFEFVVDDLIITKPNYCAPEEFPTCCEVSFRNSVFVSICDREFGHCLDPCMPKCGKSCLFSLETPISEDDKLHIHIYKKKTEQCKFLIGCTDLPIKGVFDKVMENFNIENPNWQDVSARHVKTLPNPKESKKPPEIVDNDCDSYEEGRREQLCPTSELTKQLLPLFNLKGCQTGNVVLLIRLVAIGPAIVSSFTFSRICNAGCEKKAPNCGPTNRPSGDKGACDTTCSRFAGGMDNGISGACGNENPTGSKQNKTNTGCMPLRDPCVKEVKKPVCQRYFACNADKGIPCDVVEDECERSAKCKEYRQKLSCCLPSEQSNNCSCDDCMDECEAVEDSCPPIDPFKCEPCSAETCDDCVKDPCSPCGQCMQPCFQTPRQPDPGPEAYDEFEACLNGSGLVIRLLKDTHQVENICDGTEEFNDVNASECNKYSGKENTRNSDCSLSNILQCSNFARNHIKRRTGGHIVNHPDLPKIRANIKYSGNDNCYTEKYHVPYSKIKSHCDNQTNKIDNYRSHRSRYSRNESDVCQPKHPKDEKNCCVQVDRQDIRNIMKGLDVDTRKKGIEVCYKTCEETDSDVFLVKLGSKQKSERKKNNIEIELKTPKLPVTMAKQHVTTETQIDENELDAALADICKAKKGKGGKGKKKNK